MNDSKKNQFCFIDPRTGEVISEEEIRAACEPIYDGRSRGRGRLLGRGSSSGIREQLRMKNPIGSSNYSIEAYFRERQNAYKNLASKKPILETPKTLCPPSEPVKRVKATRKKSTTNALMTHLLSQIKLTTEEENASKDEKINSNNNYDENSNDNNSSTSNIVGSSTVSCK